jgi:hypothetical protein
MRDSTINDFYNITMTGRLCYIFMCIERYLTSLYPIRDWIPVAQKMWQWTTHCWDESWDIYSEAVPEYILEFDSYEETNRQNYDGRLSKNHYDSVTALFKDITDRNGDNADEFRRILMIPSDFGSICDGTSFKAAEPLVAELIEEIECILNRHDIPLPDKTLLNRFQFDRKSPLSPDEKNLGWGDFENTEFLSVILDKQK